MNDSIQVTSSASAGASKGPLPAKGSADINADSNGEPGEFTAVFANYLQDEPAANNQKMDADMAEMLAALLPSNLSAPSDDGKLLPEQGGENPLVWQAFMQIQPLENVLASKNGEALQTQGINLLDPQRKAVAATPILSQDFLQFAGLNSEDQVNALTKGGAEKNIIAQIAALQIEPATKDSILFNLGDQQAQAPLHATNTVLSNSLSALGFGTATQVATTQTHMAPLSMTQGDWASNLGSRLQMLIGQHSQQADIRLDPPDLGSLDVKIKISNDTASVSFSSPHSHVRDAIESAVPRLREMFADSGLSLGDVNVRQESFAQHQNPAGDEGMSSGQFSSFAPEEDSHEIARKIVSNNLLDTYA